MKMTPKMDPKSIGLDHQKSIVFATLSLGPLLAPFWLHLGPLWLPLGSLWLPFGSLLAPFGSLLAPFGSLLVLLGSLLLTRVLNFHILGVAKSYSLKTFIEKQIVDQANRIFPKSVART